jgi:E3 ubiquitin-protein ligase RNF115/126
MENRKYWCFSCDKQCDIIKTVIDGDEVYQCSICKNTFVEEMEEKTPVQNSTNNINNINNININSNATTSTTNNRNRINIIISQNTTANSNIIRNNINNSNNNTNNNQNINTIQDEYGLNNTLLFLPSTVHYRELNRNNFIPNIINSVGSLFTGAGPLSNFFSSSLNNSNSLLSFLSNHNNDSQFNNLINIIMSFESSLHGNPPASQRAMDNLPKIEINKDNYNKFKDITCNICLEGFIEGNVLRVLECNHEFHENCIITWLKQRNTCPVCRHELESNDPNYERRKNNHRENLRNLHRNNNNNNGGNSGTFA